MLSVLLDHVAPLAGSHSIRLAIELGSLLILHNIRNLSPVGGGSLSGPGDER